MFFGRKSFTGYLAAQVALMDAMRNSIQGNTTTIEEIKQQDKATGVKLDQLITSVDDLHERSGETLKVLRELQGSPRKRWF